MACVDEAGGVDPVRAAASPPSAARRAPAPAGPPRGAVARVRPHQRVQALGRVEAPEVEREALRQVARRRAPGRVPGRGRVETRAHDGLLVALDAVEVVHQAALLGGHERQAPREAHQAAREREPQHRLVVRQGHQHRPLGRQRHRQLGGGVEVGPQRARLVALRRRGRARRAAPAPPDPGPAPTRPRPRRRRRPATGAGSARPSAPDRGGRPAKRCTTTGPSSVVPAGKCGAQVR